MLKRIKKILNRPISIRQIAYALVITVGVFFAAAAIRMILSDVNEDMEARVEYDHLREAFSVVVGTPVSEFDDDETETDEAVSKVEHRELSLDELAAINGDFIGWINALNRIDYPVVRGKDNEKYINTTFFGSNNSAGTIFMDYRHVNGFDEQVAVLYGHFTRDGSMFSALINFLDPAYRRNNPNINITTRDGRKITYRVFAAEKTDAWDMAYSVSIHNSSSAAEVFPNVPDNASRFLLLSTCTRSSDENERILVYAAAVG